MLCVLAGVGISIATIAIDDGHLIPKEFTGGANAALVILGTIAASMITLTGLVLTIVLVVVQLAMGQFTPRIVRAILHDRPSQVAIGVFAATFAHAMLAMREIESTDADATVPGLAIVVAFVLVVVSIMVLISYVHHIGQALRVASLIESVGIETRKLLDEVYPAAANDSGEAAVDVVTAPSSGVLFRVDRDGLVKLAAEAGCVFELVPAVGDYVPAGATLFRVEGDTGRLNRRAAVNLLALGLERTMNQDLAYGFRMLVDIAIRSLSDSFDDPTTAVAAIDRLHDCLRQLAVRPFPDGTHRDDAGNLRLIVHEIDWAGYVQLAFDEIRERGDASVQVTRRLRAALDDLLAIAPADRREPLERQARLLEEACGDRPGGPTERDVALTPDPQGIGSARELQVGVADADDGRRPENDGAAGRYRREGRR